MTKNLVIVESPAKAKTIEKYLGKDYSVLSSVGHVRSIAKKTASKTPPVDVNNNFETTYEIDPEKRKVIAELKKAVKEDGVLILSGILDKYVDKVEAKFASMKLVEKYQKEEWFTLILQRK